jgi:hypothetical protein
MVEPRESALGHVMAHFVSADRPHVRFDRDIVRRGSRKGSPHLGWVSSPEEIRKFAVRLLVWAEEIAAWREAKRLRMILAACRDMRAGRKAADDLLSVPTPSVGHPILRRISANS